MSREFRARQLIAMRIVDICFHARMTRDTLPDPRDGSRYLRSGYGSFEPLRAAPGRALPVRSFRLPIACDVRDHIQCVRYG